MNPPADAIASSPPARSLTLVEILTVGLPFCVFKVACGVPLIGLGRVRWLGWLLVAWGVADALLNVVNALSVGTMGRRRVSVCLLQAATRAVRPSARSANFGTALDVMLSFVLVAVMIGAGGLSLLTHSWLWAWNVAVVLNVLGAGALRMADALRLPE